MSEVAESIVADIRSALDKDQLDLPSLPEVALRIRDEAESEHVSATSLSAVVSEDPGLATQLVRVANSPMFRATRSIDDLSQAISRLGVDYSANIVTGMAMQQMFQATSEFVDRKIRDIWKHSIDLAAWSSILTKRFTNLRPDQATLAGLTHSIGTLPILSWVEENDHLIQDSLTLDRVIDSIHPSIGTMILQHWNFADEIVAVPSGYADLTRESKQLDYVDVVCVANLLNLADTDHPLNEQDWGSVSAFSRLGIDPNMDELERASLLEEVEGVKQAMH